MVLDEDMLMLAGVIISRRKNKEVVRLLYKKHRETVNFKDKEEKEKGRRLYFNQIFRELGGSRSSLAGALDELVIHKIVKNMVAKIPEGLVRFYSLTDDKKVLELVETMYKNGMLN